MAEKYAGQRQSICDALRDLVPLVQFKKRKKTPMKECYF